MNIKQEKLIVEKINEFYNSHQDFFSNDLTETIDLEDYLEQIDPGALNRYKKVLLPSAYDVSILKKYESNKIFCQFNQEAAEEGVLSALCQINKECHLVFSLYYDLDEEEEEFSMFVRTYLVFKKGEDLAGFIKENKDLQIYLSKERGVGFK